MTTTGEWGTTWTGRTNLAQNMHILTEQPVVNTTEEIARARRRTTRLVTAAGGSTDDLATVLDALGLREVTA